MKEISIRKNKELKCYEIITHGSKQILKGYTIDQ